VKISEVIRRLQVIYKGQGDITVARDDFQDHDMPLPITGVSVRSVKPHCDAFVFENRLNTGGYAGRPKFTQPYLSEIKAQPSQFIVFIE